VHFIYQLRGEENLLGIKQVPFCYGAVTLGHVCNFSIQVRTGDELPSGFACTYESQLSFGVRTNAWTWPEAVLASLWKHVRQ